MVICYGACFKNFRRLPLYDTRKRCGLHVDMDCTAPSEEIDTSNFQIPNEFRNLSASALAARNIAAIAIRTGAMHDSTALSVAAVDNTARVYRQYMAHSLSMAASTKKPVEIFTGL